MIYLKISDRMVQIIQVPSCSDCELQEQCHKYLIWSGVSICFRFIPKNKLL